MKIGFVKLGDWKTCHMTQQRQHAGRQRLGSLWESQHVDEIVRKFARLHTGCSARGDANLAILDFELCRVLEQCHTGRWDYRLAAQQTQAHVHSEDVFEHHEECLLFGCGG